MNEYKITAKCIKAILFYFIPALKSFYTLVGIKNPKVEKMKTYVIHVRGNHEREKHIKHELQKHNIDYEFILDGNMEDITEIELEKYFCDDYKKANPRTSCVLKHFYAYQKIIENNIPMALIFEDDIELFGSFQYVFEAAVKEAVKETFLGYIISYETSNQKFISKSEIVTGKYLYQKNTGRCAGAYLIDNAAAKMILEYAVKNKCNMNVDWLHNELSGKEMLKIFWCHPPVAEQQSHSGKIKSLLDSKKKGSYYRIKYFLQKFWKEKLISRFR